jgi:competence protein ComGC
MGSLLKEFWLFLKEEKKWWLVPMLIVMGLVAALVLLTQFAPGVAPFIYPLI